MRGVIAQIGDSGGSEGGNGDGAAGEVTVIDMEASIEHLSRGTLRHTDVLLILVEPYFRAMETAARTVGHARDLHIPRIFAVANKVRTSQDEQAIADYCAAHDLPVIATVPFDEHVTDADRTGQALLDVAPHSSAAVAVAGLADRLLEH